MATLDVRFSALLVVSLFAQDTTIRTNVPLVVVPVSVTDERGPFVYGLHSSDFLARDNDESRPVRVDDPDSIAAPLDLVALIQTSDISGSALMKIKKVGTMIQDAVIGANGAGAVVTFADRVKVVQEFTSNDEDFAVAFRNLHSVDSRDGKLLDAVAKGLDLLANRPTGRRRVLVIIGESKDRGSEMKTRNLLPEIQRSGVTIYSLSYSAYLTPFTTKASEYSPPEGGSGWILDSITEAVHATKQDTCKVLTEATGGRQLKFETKSKLENDLIRLGTEIHSRYMVSFAPGEPSAAGFHKISVEIRGRPELHVQARPGYWAAAEATKQ
jgi:VWFA-related protein